MADSLVHGTTPVRDAAVHGEQSKHRGALSANAVQAPAAQRVNCERLSAQADANPTCLIAIFAHNEAGRIGAALRSLEAAANGMLRDVVVLANGCTDSTANEVRSHTALIPNLSLMEIALADKANAWNVLIHDVIGSARAERLEMCFCMDGDVTLLPNALTLLASALRGMPSAYAAGAMPATGRDRDAWRQRMIAYGNLSGNLYALRGGFVRRLREGQIRMPIGLIGEDFLVSWLVTTDLGTRRRAGSGPQCVFHTEALFSFRSLSPWQPSDYVRYLRRKWRCTWRALQHQMLVSYLGMRGLKAMLASVDRLYREAPMPSRLVWVGLDTPMRLLAAMWIRFLRNRQVRGLT